MVMNKIVCNRCGKELSDFYKQRDYSAKIEFWAIGVPRYSAGQRIDLCAECEEQFVNFMEGKLDWSE